MVIKKCAVGCNEREQITELPGRSIVTRRVMHIHIPWDKREHPRGIHRGYIAPRVVHPSRILRVVPLHHGNPSLQNTRIEGVIAKSQNGPRLVVVGLKLADSEVECFLKRENSTGCVERPGNPASRPLLDC